MSQTSEYLERRHGECLQKARGIDEQIGDRVPELLRYIDAQLRDEQADESGATNEGKARMSQLTELRSRAEKLKELKLL